MFALGSGAAPGYAAGKAMTLKGISSLKLDSDPLGSPEQTRAVTGRRHFASVLAPRCHDRAVA